MSPWIDKPLCGVLICSFVSYPETSCHFRSGDKRWMEMYRQSRNFRPFSADYYETLFQVNVKDKSLTQNQKQMLQQLLV